MLGRHWLISTIAAVVTVTVVLVIGMKPANELRVTSTPGGIGTTTGNIQQTKGAAAGGVHRVIPTSRLTVTSQQPLTPLPYSLNSASITSKRLPFDVLSHLWGNTSTVTASNGFGKCITTNCGANTNSGVDSTWGALNLPTYGNYGVPAIYWAQPTDPWWKINGCYYCTPGWSATFQAPSNALIAGSNYSGDGDNQFTVISPNLTTVTQVYGAPGMACGGSPNFCASVRIGVCPGGGHAGTQADPCPFPVYWSSASQSQNYYTSQDWQSLNAQGYRNKSNTLGLAPYAGTIRVDEILAGLIPHAVYSVIDCINSSGTCPGSGCTKQDTVFPGWPGTPGTLACTSARQNRYRPYEGMLFFADYSDAQLACLDPAQPVCQYSDRTKIPKVQAFQMMFLYQLAHYGQYVGETGPVGTFQPYPGFDDDTGPSWLFQFPDTNAACSKLLNASPYWTWACSIQSTLGASYMSIRPRTGPNPSAEFATMGTFVNIPLMTGITGATDSNGRSCASGHGCDLSGHVQIADPCVVIGMAGLSSSNGVKACP